MRIFDVPILLNFFFSFFSFLDPQGSAVEKHDMVMAFSFFWPELSDWHSMPTWLMQTAVIPSCCQLFLVCSLPAFGFCRHINFLIAPVGLSKKQIVNYLTKECVYILISLSGLYVCSAVIASMACPLPFNFVRLINWSFGLIGCKIHCFPSLLSTVASNKGTNWVTSSAIWFKFWRMDKCKAGCPSYWGADNGQVCFSAECLTVLHVQ